ncbi:MAG: hypothetical protein R2697_01595 [Ilumatobacteraceae bacterium]
MYTPPAGENGNISFNYTVRNSCRIQATGVVVIDVNQDPVAAAYEANIGRIDPHTIPVTSLATDAELLRIVALEGALDLGRAIDDQRDPRRAYRPIRPPRHGCRRRRSRGPPSARPDRSQSRQPRTHGGG